MTKQHHKKHKTPYQNWLVPGVIGLVFLMAIGFLVKVMMTDDGPRRKNQISTVTLLKAPPEIKEKPPEPEVQKEAPKENITTPIDAPQPENQAQDQPPDNAPAGSDLGVEGEGGAGSDAFGLRGGIKGGRSVTLGSGGGLNRLSLLTKYGGYTQKIQEEIKRQVKKKLDQDGGIPKGKFQTTVKIVLNTKGAIVKFQVVGSSGNSKVDEAVRATLGQIRVSEPPPEGMPAGMTIKVTSQG